MTQKVSSPMRLKFVSWDTFCSLGMIEQRRPDLPEMKASSRVPHREY